MRNLYKLFGFAKIITNRGVLEENINKANLVDKNLGDYVLLHKARKDIYDRTYTNLELIGKLRTGLDISNTEYWNENKYRDFNPEFVVNSSKKYSKIKIQKRDFGFKYLRDNLMDLFVVMSFVAIVLAAYFQDDADSTVVPYVKHSKLMHVTSKKLNLRSEPSVKSKVIRTLKQYQNITRLNEVVDSNWVYVKTTDNHSGYVSTKYVIDGDGHEAYISSCRKDGITRPANGYVLSKKYKGPHRLVVNNSPGADALIKLKDDNKNTVLEYYIRSGQTVTINDIPEGQYQFLFASGSDYSANCNRFLTNMQASKDPKPTPYITKRSSNSVSYSIQTYTLQRVRNGNFQAQKINTSEF